MHRMITMHARPRQTDGRTNIITIARRFVLTNASRAKNVWPIRRRPLRIKVISRPRRSRPRVEDNTYPTFWWYFTFRAIFILLQYFYRFCTPRTHGLIRAYSCFENFLEIVQIKKGAVDCLKLTPTTCHMAWMSNSMNWRWHNASVVTMMWTCARKQTSIYSWLSIPHDRIN